MSDWLVIPAACQDEHDFISRRRPHGNAHRDCRIPLERDLTNAGTVGPGDPQVAVAAAVGQVDHLRFIRTHRRGLRLAGLVCDANAAARVLRRRPVDRKFPDVRLHADSAGRQPAGRVHVGLHVGHVTERELAIARPVPLDRSQVEHGWVEHRAPCRGAVDNTRAAWQPRESPQVSTTRDLSHVTARRGRDDENAACRNHVRLSC